MGYKNWAGLRLNVFIYVLIYIWIWGGESIVSMSAGFVSLCKLLGLVFTHPYVSITDPATVTENPHTR